VTGDASAIDTFADNANASGAKALHAGSGTGVLTTNACTVWDTMALTEYAEEPPEPDNAATLTLPEDTRAGIGGMGLIRRNLTLSGQCVLEWNFCRRLKRLASEAPPLEVATTRALTDTGTSTPGSLFGFGQHIATSLSLGPSCRST
jgi:hypothetical protein